MTGFLVRRAVESALVLLAVSFVVYALIGLMPGDPIDLMLQADPSLTSADAARLKALQGLDRPLVERWLAWLGRAAQGDFGYSRLYSVPAVDGSGRPSGQHAAADGQQLCPGAGRGRAGGGMGRGAAG